MGWDGEIGYFGPVKASCSFSPGSLSERNLKKLMAGKGDGKGELSTDTGTS